MKKDIQLDLIRAIAACMVVAIHVVGGIMNRSIYNSSEWWMANIIGAFLRQCVPLFVMISGALLLSKNQDINQFYKRRINKILVPIIFWTIIYQIVNIYIYSNKNQYEKITLTNILESIYIGEPYYILWYIYMIIGLYLFAPFLKAMLDSLSKKWSYIFAIGMMICAGIYGIERYILFDDTKTFFIFKSFMYIGYFVIGYLIYVDRDKINITYKDYLLIFISIITIILGNYCLPNISFLETDYFQKYNSIHVLIAAVPTYKVLLNLKVKNKYVNIIDDIAKNSMGMYLVHPLVILFISRIYYIFDISGVLICMIMPIDIIFTIFISWLISKIINKIPILRRVV